MTFVLRFCRGREVLVRRDASECRRGLWIAIWVRWCLFREYFNLMTRVLGFPGGSAVKYLPAMQEMWVRSLGLNLPSREDALEEVMATHSSTLARNIPMDRGAWWATVHGAAKSWTQLK